MVQVEAKTGMDYKIELKKNFLSYDCSPATDDSNHAFVTILKGKTA